MHPWVRIIDILYGPIKSEYSGKYFTITSYFWVGNSPCKQSFFLHKMLEDFSDSSSWRELVFPLEILSMFLYFAFIPVIWEGCFM